MKNITTITNSFTGYSAEIKTAGIPALSTIQKHLRKAKAKDCKSQTIIRINGIRHSIEWIGGERTLAAIE